MTQVTFSVGWVNKKSEMSSQSHTRGEWKHCLILITATTLTLHSALSIRLLCPLKNFKTPWFSNYVHRKLFFSTLDLRSLFFVREYIRWRAAVACSWLCKQNKDPVPKEHLTFTSKVFLLLTLAVLMSSSCCLVRTGFQAIALFSWFRIISFNSPRL